MRSHQAMKRLLRWWSHRQSSRELLSTSAASWATTKSVGMWNHQSKDNVLLFPAVSHDTECQGLIQCRERLGGLLKYYAREAA